MSRISLSFTEQTFKKSVFFRAIRQIRVLKKRSLSGNKELAWSRRLGDSIVCSMSNDILIACENINPQYHLFEIDSHTRVHYEYTVDSQDPVLLFGAGARHSGGQNQLHF